VLAAKSSLPSAERARGRTWPVSNRVKDESELAGWVAFGIALGVARDFADVSREDAKEFAGAIVWREGRGLGEGAAASTASSKMAHAAAEKCLDLLREEIDILFPDGSVELAAAVVTLPSGRGSVTPGRLSRCADATSWRAEIEWSRGLFGPIGETEAFYPGEFLGIVGRQDRASADGCTSDE
jgi:hypothetical protein